MSPEVEAQLLQDVGAIKAKVDFLAAATTADGARIAKLERRSWIASGFIAAVTAYIVPALRTKLGI